ncbi:hypothetical protein AQUCO_01800101v1 [Aquilegia coerulea]|uniref:Uncharacterized protein n=1 Tax=Aquilegia coerulea TaxID=218851 RepID=A0A2G5DJZ7_AQUCA|nr:hypothetical protein AQUCO_01800101v1 [Aquilegia coerulea]
MFALLQMEIFFLWKKKKKGSSMSGIDLRSLRFVWCSLVHLCIPWKVLELASVGFNLRTMLFISML